MTGSILNNNLVCRTCLSENALTPIFKNFNSLIVTNSLFIATGVKIQINDDLPKNMCTECVNTIKNIINFRNKCHEAERKLILSIKADKKQNILKKNQMYLDDIVPQNKMLEKKSCKGNKVDIKNEDSFSNSPENVDDYDEEDNKPLHYLSSSPGQIVEQDVCMFSGNESIDKERDGRLEKQDKQLESNRRKKSREIVECDECNKKMLNASLRQHKRVSHAGIRPKCEHCGRKFGNKLRLTEHYRAKHGYEKLKCRTCDFQSSSESAMKNHERLHSGEKPFVCEICGCKFHAAYLLSQHRQSHRSQNTVKCKLCAATFKANNTLHTHMRTCHSQHSYRCGICKKSFAALVYAKRHCKSVHGALGMIDSVPKTIAAKHDDCPTTDEVTYSNNTEEIAV